MFPGEWLTWESTINYLSVRPHPRHSTTMNIYECETHWVQWVYTLLLCARCLSEHEGAPQGWYNYTKDILTVRFAITCWYRVEKMSRWFLLHESQRRKQGRSRDATESHNLRPVCALISYWLHPRWSTVFDLEETSKTVLRNHDLRKATSWQKWYLNKSQRNANISLNMPTVRVQMELICAFTTI